MNRDKYSFEMNNRRSRRKGAPPPFIVHFSSSDNNPPNQRIAQTSKKKRGECPKQNARGAHNFNRSNRYVPHQNHGVEGYKSSYIQYDENKSSIFYDAYFLTIFVCLFFIALFISSFFSCWMMLAIGVAAFFVQCLSSVIENKWNKYSNFNHLKHRKKHAAIVNGILFLMNTMGGVIGWALKKDSYIFWFSLITGTILIVLYFVNQHLVNKGDRHNIHLRPYSTGVAAALSVSFAVSASSFPSEKGSITYSLIAYFLPIIIFGITIFFLFLLNPIGESKYDLR